MPQTLGREVLSNSTRRMFAWFAVELANYKAVITTIVLMIVIFWVGIPYYQGATDAGILYAGSHLAGAGNPYNKTELCQEQSKVPEIRHCLGIARLPWYLFILKGLTWLSFSSFRYVWLVVNSAAFLIVAFSWPEADRPWRAILSGALWDLLHLGQDTTLFMLCATLSMLSLMRGRDRSAGFFLALCTMKYNLGALVVLLLFARKQWKVLGYGSVFTLMLLLASVLVQGLSFPKQIVGMARFADNFKGAMPTFRSFSNLLPFSEAVELFLVVLVLAACWKVFKTDSISTGFSLALAGSVLISRHAGSYDNVLVVPLFFEAFRYHIRGAWLLLFAPYIYLWMENWHGPSIAPIVWSLLIVVPTMTYFILAVSERRRSS